MIKTLVLSDIHLGHNKTTTEFIVDNLKFFFKSNLKEFKQLDLIIIPGDIFDRLLTNNSLDSIKAYAWLAWLVDFCDTYNIKLRILEGTPSHDWKQVTILYKIIKELNKNIDFKYYDDIDIEFLKIGNVELSILYIPDEIEETAEKIWLRVKDKMSEHDLTKVDLVVMHGAFKYQLPIKHLPFLHDENDYNDITNLSVIVGHVHNKSTYGKILCPGSFDSLTFADEGVEKGGWILNIKENGTVTKKFIKNKHSKIFKTINLTTNNDFSKILKILPDYSEIRLLVNEDENVKELAKEIMFKFPNKRISIKSINSTSKQDLKLSKSNKKELFTFKINKDNIEELIRKELTDKDLENNYIEDELKLLLS